MSFWIKAEWAVFCCRLANLPKTFEIIVERNFNMLSSGGRFLVVYNLLVLSGGPFLLVYNLMVLSGGPFLLVYNLMLSSGGHFLVVYNLMFLSGGPFLLVYNLMLLKWRASWLCTTSWQYFLICTVRIAYDLVDFSITLLYMQKVVAFHLGQFLWVTRYATKKFADSHVSYVLTTLRSYNRDYRVLIS